MSETQFRLAPSLARALAGEPVRVGTENRAKLGAVEDALGRFLEPGGRLMIESARVASGVPEQPVGFDQIAGGARNRARAAFASGECTLAFGIEDGLVRMTHPVPGSPDADSNEQVFNVGCAFVFDGEREGHGFSSGFAYPPGCLDAAMRDQAPIGGLFDALLAKSSPDGLAPRRSELLWGYGRRPGKRRAIWPSGRQYRPTHPGSSRPKRLRVTSNRVCPCSLSARRPLRLARAAVRLGYRPAKEPKPR